MDKSPLWNQVPGQPKARIHRSGWDPRCVGRPVALRHMVDSTHLKETIKCKSTLAIRTDARRAAIVGQVM